MRVMLPLQDAVGCCCNDTAVLVTVWCWRAEPPPWLVSFIFYCRGTRQPRVCVFAALCVGSYTVQNADVCHHKTELIHHMSDLPALHVALWCHAFFEDYM